MPVPTNAQIEAAARALYETEPRFAEALKKGRLDVGVRKGQATTLWNGCASVREQSLRQQLARGEFPDEYRAPAAPVLPCAAAWRVGVCSASARWTQRYEDRACINARCLSESRCKAKDEMSNRSDDPRPQPAITMVGVKRPACSNNAKKWRSYTRRRRGCTG